MGILGQLNREVPTHPKDTGQQDPMHKRNIMYGERNRAITQNSEAFDHFITKLAPQIHKDPKAYFETAEKNPQQVAQLRDTFSKAWASPEGKQMVNSLEAKSAEEKQANELFQIRNFLQYHDLAASIKNAYAQYETLVSIQTTADKRTALLKEKLRDTVFKNTEYQGPDAYKKLASHVNQAGNSVLAKDLISRAKHNLSAMPEADQDLYRGFQLLDRIAQEGAPQQKPEVTESQKEHRQPEAGGFGWILKYATNIRDMDLYQQRQMMPNIRRAYELGAKTIDPPPGSIPNTENNTLIYQNQEDVKADYDAVGAKIFNYLGVHTRNYDELANFMSALPSRLRQSITKITDTSPHQKAWQEATKRVADRMLKSGETEELVAFLMDVPKTARTVVVDQHKKDKQFGYIARRLEEETYRHRATR